MTFEFATAQRILFGCGRAAEAPALARAVGPRVLLVCGSAPDRLPEPFRACATQVLRVAGEPTFDGVRAGLEAARAAGITSILAAGGGSTIDFGKALAMLIANGGDPMDYAEVIGAGKPVTRASLPLIAVPTTAGAGSEATRNAVLRDPLRGVKVSLRSPLMLPAAAVVDPDLTLGLPPALTAATGMDALSQLVEPFLSARAQPMTDALCREGMARVARALPRAFAHGDDRVARTDMALGALLGGMALANAGLGAVHGFAAVIGGMCDAAHGAVCAALLAPVLEANARALAAAGDPPRLERLAELARILTGRPGADLAAAVAWIRELAAALGIPPLGSHGLPAACIPDVCRQAAQASSMKANPVLLGDAELREILARAW